MKKGPIPSDFEPRRILVLQLRQVGDALMCTPALRALRGRYPDTRIDVFVEPAPAAVLAGNPHIDNLVVRHPKRGWIETPAIIHKIRSARYDLVIDYHGGSRTAVLSLLSGATHTVSFAGKSRSRFYKHLAEPEGEYSGAQKLNLLKVLGITGGDPRPVFSVPPKARLDADEFLQGNGLRPGGFIAVDSTHRRATRLWKRFGELADLLRERHGVPSVFLWGPGEESYVDGVLGSCRFEHVKGPRPSFDATGAILEKAAALVGTCSAPAHIAAAVGTPSLQVIGSSRPGNWVLPEPIHDFVWLGAECQPCCKNDCHSGDLHCLENLPAERVLEKIVDLSENAPGLRNLLDGGK